jgi:hypothetical protein
MKQGFFLLTILFLTACASTKQFVKMPTGDSKTANKAVVYIIRPSFLATAVGMRVYCNDVYVGKTGPKGYLCFELNEGDNRICCKAENRDYFSINAKAGATYYLKQELKMGYAYSRVALKPLDKVQADAFIKRLHRPIVNYME